MKGARDSERLTLESQRMNPLLYALIGLVAGAAIAAIIFAITRRKRDDDAELIKRLELLEHAQERGERLIREEMARSREENANAARTLTRGLWSQPRSWRRFCIRRYSISVITEPAGFHWMTCPDFLAGTRGNHQGAAI